MCHVRKGVEKKLAGKMKDAQRNRCLGQYHLSCNLRIFRMHCVQHHRDQ